jgi:hypothetical protein
MKPTLVKYFVLLIFIIASAVLFFSGNIIAEYLYDKFMYREALLDRVMDYYYFVIKLWGAYILLLLAVAVAGILWSRKANKKEVYKGFVFSMVFSILLLVIYVIGLLDAFFF